VNTNLPTEYGDVDSPIDGAAYSGPITFTLPRGLKVVDVSSSAGNVILSEDDGRQTVTYIVPPGEFEDDLTFRIQVGWIYFLIQFWVYPAIVLLLLVMFVRRRRRKKKRKKNAIANRQAAVNKAQIGDHEFADLAGFSSPALRHGETIEDMAHIDELSR
jgi:ATP-dependent Zn protease